jgi:hypothetical protein
MTYILIKLLYGIYFIGIFFFIVNMASKSLFARKVKIKEYWFIPFWPLLLLSRGGLKKMSKLIKSL